MTDKKNEISDRERERRAKQAAQQQQKQANHGGPPGGQGAKQGGYHPANTVARITKSTGRGS